MIVHLLISQPGPQTTVQDRGRLGAQAYGVPVCGALDAEALALANALVGNPAEAAALECRLLGPSFTVEGGPARFALAGAEAQIELTQNGETRRLPAWRAFDAPAGATIRIGALKGSGCAILAMAGGCDVPSVLGSRTTDLKGGFGGHHGRALIAGDRLQIGAADLKGPCLALPRPPDLGFDGVLRVVLGPQDEAFSAEALETFLSATYQVSREADRMGIRLEGPTLGFRTGADITSDGIATGCIQVPGSGLPIILLADHQTVGGYAKVATVISADLPRAGRLLPGATLRFAAVSVAEAEAARRARAGDLARHVASLQPVQDGARINVEALFTTNLISGVVTAFDTGYLQPTDQFP